jgi:hypothetical protein
VAARMATSRLVTMASWAATSGQGGLEHVGRPRPGQRVVQQRGVRDGPLDVSRATRRHDMLVYEVLAPTRYGVARSWFGRPSGVVEARGNPVGVRDCPAAVSGNDRRQRSTEPPGPGWLGKRRPVGGPRLCPWSGPRVRRPASVPRAVVRARPVRGRVGRPTARRAPLRGGWSLSSSLRAAGPDRERNAGGTR